MKKFMFLGIVVLMLVSLILSGCAGQAPSTGPGAQPAKTINLKFATFIPPMDTYAVQQGEWAKQLETATNGRIKITFYHAESLIKMPDLFDATAAGTVDFSMIDSNLTPERLPLSGITTLPMVFKRASQTQQVMWALLEKYSKFKGEYAPTKVIWCQNPSTAQLYGNKPLQKLDDLKGQKVAIVTPWEALSLKALGMTPVGMPPTEMFTALERGVVDAASGDFNQAFIWKHFEITKYRTDNVDITARVSPIIMNIKTYNNLPDDLKKIFDKTTNGLEMSKRAGLAFEDFMANSIKMIKEFDQKKGNPAIYVLPSDERQKWLNTVSPVRDQWVAEMEKKGLPGKDMLKDMIELAEKYK